MKPTTPHDPLDDLIAAALHGELTPEERTQFDARLRNEPATQAAYQKAQLMHDLLEKTHKNAQPDSDFERRMVSGVRRKLQTEQHKETAWESLLAVWALLRKFPRRFRLVEVAVVLGIVAIMAGVALGPITSGIKKSKQSAEMQAAHAQALADSDASLDAAKAIDGATGKDLRKVIEKQGVNYVETAQNGVTLSGYVDTSRTEQFAGAPQHAMGGVINSGNVQIDAGKRADAKEELRANMAATAAAPPPVPQAVFAIPLPTASPNPMKKMEAPDITRGKTTQLASGIPRDSNRIDELKQSDADKSDNPNDRNGFATGTTAASVPVPTFPAAPPPPAIIAENSAKPSPDAVREEPASIDANTPAAPVIDTRKLIRNAQLDLEVKGYQTAVDQITALTKSAGGYVDTSNSQKGGNGKLQGTVVVKVLPQNLDSFLLKLRDLGQLRNQSVSTDDVTKDYIDTQARLDNSRKMEAQLQDLLKHTNGKVSELLQVERELGRVRGEIEQMQGQLKLYDFQVQYATITISMRETDLNQTAAYLLKENDNFSLFATNVEETFQQTRKSADDFKGHILSANLNHNSGSDVAATLIVSVPPDQIEAFLAQLRSMGRVDNFTRQTQRVPKDGGDTDQPADQTLTDKDKVIVNITIRSDDQSRKQVSTTVVTPAVDDALDKAKTAALSNSAEILSSSLNKTPQGQSNGQLSVRVQGKNYHALLDAYKTLGRTAAFSLQREDNSGPGANGDDEPVIIGLFLTDEETPLQHTEMSVLATDVDGQAQQLKKDAAAYSVQVKASSFEREPNGMEVAQMTFRLPMSKYPSFVENLKKLGHVESLSVNRVDRPDQTRSNDTAPAETSLRLHNQGNIVAEDSGLMATLRETFGDGAAALFGSVRVIGVLIAFVIPWFVAIGVIAWVARRIYIWKKK